MKLINVKTLEIEIFTTEEHIPRYAVLSHTWGEDEVSYHEWIANIGNPSPDFLEKSGYLKIINACSKTQDDRLPYIWADTVCIDKTSSAELSEAINSMFAWYERAHVCIVYLSDVAWEEGLTDKTHANKASGFSSSRWFTRGWTLQELLAPQKVFFFTREWTEIGTKSDLMFPISKITGIDVTYLAENRKIWSASIAARMSWASKRQTTRLEDMAYCLLGIFDINMPLLYGEGSRAFLRLQEEIIKASEDHTIFCWSWDPDKIPSSWQSVLAPSPFVFSNSASFVAVYSNSDSNTPFQVTNLGLRIRLPVVAAVNCLCAMLSVISTDDADPEHRRMMCLPLMEEGRVCRRCPFPSRPFPVHRAMVCDAKEMYLLSKVSRNTEDLMPWPYRHQFEYSFYINIIDESFSTDMNRQMITSVDCLVPQYMQTPSSHVSRPVYSAVGFRSTLTQGFGGLILRVNYQNERLFVLLSVSRRSGINRWSCEVLDAKYEEYDVPAWVHEFQRSMNGGTEPQCTFHTATSKTGNSRILVALDKEVCDTAGRAMKMVYLVLGTGDDDSPRMTKTWAALEDAFSSNVEGGRRLLSRKY